MHSCTLLSFETGRRKIVGKTLKNKPKPIKMIVNNIDQLIDNYKKLKKSFKVRESANYIELITSTGQKIYQNKSKRFTGGLYLFGMVKKDIQNYLEENGEVEPYEELPVNYINTKFDYEKDIIGMDINNAYWHVALLKGYITDITYEKGLEKEGGCGSPCGAGSWGCLRRLCRIAREDGDMPVVTATSAAPATRPAELILARPRRSSQRRLDSSR